jgi:hypothetical protein
LSLLLAGADAPLRALGRTRVRAPAPRTAACFTRPPRRATADERFRRIRHGHVSHARFCFAFLCLRCRTLLCRTLLPPSPPRAVHKPREQAVDTELMVVLAGCGLQLAKGLTPGAASVSPSDFLARLRCLHMAGFADAAPDEPPSAAAFDWVALGKSVGKLFRWAPTSAPHMCAHALQRLLRRTLI